MGLFRQHIDWERAAPFMAAAAPGAFVGGVLAVAIPPALLQLSMALAAGLAVARHAGWLTLDVPPGALAPAGFGIGVASSAGGAGAIAGPVLLSAGLSGSAYLATMSLGSLSMHAGRLVAFGSGGQLDRATLQGAALLAVAIVAGNALGRRIRERLGNQRVAGLEVATAVGLVVLSIVGLARVVAQTG